MRRYYSILCIWLLGLSLQGKAGNNGVLDIDAIRKLPIAKIDENRLAIPIRRAGNLILIKAKADTIEGNFILDTGAPYLVLNQTYFRNYRENPSEVVNGVNGALQNQKIVEVDSLLIKGISFTEVVADAIDLSQIENKKGVKILGLLGVNLFLNFELEIDLRNNVIYLNKLSAQKKCLSVNAFSRRFNPAVEVEIGLRKNMICFDAKINDKKLRLGFDTGAEYNVLGSNISNKALDGVRIARRMKMYGSSGTSSEVLAGSIGFLDIEGYKLANLQTIVTDFSSMQKAHGSKLDGLIGYPLLNRGVVCINFKEKIMRFYSSTGE